jgi:RND superfamily putative drug exporter
MSISPASPEIAAATPSGIIARLAGWTMRHRRITIIAWVIALIGVSLIATSVGTRQATNFTLPGTDSQRARDLLVSEFPTQAFTEAGSDAISKNGRIAFATVAFDQRANELPTSAVDKVISIAEGARSSNLQVELGGQAIETAQQPSFGFTTAIGVLAAIVVLLITFGSLVAMGLPIVTALLGLGTGVGLIGLGSQVLDMPDFATELAVMIGLGVGIDYSLFIVTRFRESFQRTGDVNGSVSHAMDTAGRAIVFAGCTVIIAWRR